jgi:glyceraldehyde 3-phosphate dehydrogenase
MAVKVAINGFGRIGRSVIRAALANFPNEFEFVAINDLTDTKTLAHLFKYDSVHGVLRGHDIGYEDNAILLDGKKIAVTSHREPEDLMQAWAGIEFDFLFECTGIYAKKDGVLPKLREGAKTKFMLLSAPGKDADLTAVYGVNHESFNPAEHKIVSNASCTTNCLAPVVYVLDKEFGFERGLVTTIHSYTGDQRLLDAPHKDLRRARAAAVSQIPTTTGAAKAVGKVLPHLAGKLDGMAIRVPTFNVSLVDLVATLKTEVTTEQMNGALKKWADGPLKGILQYCDEPLVSIDFNGDPHSSSYYAPDSVALGGKSNMVKALSWYDNETGYSTRMLDMAKFMMSKL